MYFSGNTDENETISLLIRVIGQLEILPQQMLLTGALNVPLQQFYTEFSVHFLL